MSTGCHGIVSSGMHADLITIECHASNNLPTIVIVGSAGRAVSEARDRLRGAFAASKLRLPRKRITINLAPADLPKHDSSIDLAIAHGILVTAGTVPTPQQSMAAIGELGLDGNVRPVRGIIGKLLAARRQGIEHFIVPNANIQQAALVPDITIWPVNNLLELVSHCTGKQLLSPLKPRQLPDAAHPSSGLSTIAGQEAAKRALLIAAAGGHNLYLSGPPGTGKSLLAKALSALLPAPSVSEALEITDLHSYEASDYSALHAERPFRQPHHSVSLGGLIGSRGRPGELSLSHRGVLCLDEFPEFTRHVIDSLRQPLEDRTIQSTYNGRVTTLPADCLVVATGNPCPCGYFGTGIRDCRCTAAALERYTRKLTGPLLERFDLWSHVSHDQPSQLFTTVDSDDGLAALIATARQRQTDRYGTAAITNATASTPVILKRANLADTTQELLTTSAVTLSLPARAIVRTIRVARTIADLSNDDQVSPAHLQEALALRRR